MRACSAPGCGRPAAGYSRHCANHKAAVRRHGAPDQKGVTKAELKPYVAKVLGRIAANPESPAWAKMDARWQTLVRHAEDILATWHAGQAMHMPKVRAAEEIVRLGGLVEAREVVVTATAMFLMDQMDASRFRGDQAFRTQLVRRVRGLTEANSTDYRDANTGKSRRTYHELGPRSAVVMAEWLTETFGILGAHLARLERQEREEKASGQQELHADLMALK
jgi:hypothetical protein